MRHWTRAKVEERCGLCGLTIYRDQPMLYVLLQGVKRKLLRCVDCAGPAPPDLPPNIEQQSIPERMASIRQAAATMPRTRKAASAHAESILSGWRDRYGESR